MSQWDKNADMAELTPNTRRTLKVAAPVLAGLMLFGACGKKDEPAASSSNNPSASSTTTAGGTKSTSGSSTDDTAGGNTGTTIGSDKLATSLNATYYLKGFKVTLSDAKIDKGANTLVVQAEIENITEADAVLYDAGGIEQDGKIYETGKWRDGATVVAGKKAKDELTFDLDNKFDPQNAILVFGDDSSAQVKIPLDGSKPTLLTPVEQAYTGDITIGQLDIKIDKAVIRWDRLDNATQADKGKAYFVLSGSAKNTSAADNLYPDADLMKLDRPDGTTSIAEKTGTESYLKPTASDTKFFIVFQVADPIDGDYTMNLSGKFAPDGAEATAPPIKLTLTTKATKSSSSSSTTTTTEK